MINKYPELKNIIITILCQNDEFRSLCADYNTCAAAVTYWSNESSNISISRRREFSQLLSDLEKEIFHFVEDVNRREQLKRNTGGQQ